MDVKAQLPNLHGRTWTFALCLLINTLLPDAVVAQTTAPATTSELPAPFSERLHYRVAYRGLFTSFIWMELARVEGIASSQPTTFDGLPTCQAELSLSTADYPFAEMLYPMRYRWLANLSPDLQRSYLVEVTDPGLNDFHKFIWFNYQEKHIELFRKRKKYVRPDLSWKQNTVDKWEGDKRGFKQPLPDFLSHYPALDNGATYLMREDIGRGVNSQSILDPLAVIYNLRQHDFTSEHTYEVEAAVDQDLYAYRITWLGKEMLSLVNGPTEAHHIQLQPIGKAAARRKGTMHLWLADDPQRTPLLFDVDAPLGSIRAVLERVNRGPVVGPGQVCKLVPDWPADSWSSTP